MCVFFVIITEAEITESFRDNYRGGDYRDRRPGGRTKCRILGRFRHRENIPCTCVSHIDAPRAALQERAKKRKEERESEGKMKAEVKSYFQTPKLMEVTMPEKRLKKIRGKMKLKKEKIMLTKQGTANIIVYALARETSSQP